MRQKIFRPTQTVMIGDEEYDVELYVSTVTTGRHLPATLWEPAQFPELEIDDHQITSVFRYGEDGVASEVKLTDELRDKLEAAIDMNRIQEYCEEDY